MESRSNTHLPTLDGNLCEEIWLIIISMLDAKTILNLNLLNTFFYSILKKSIIETNLISYAITQIENNTDYQFFVDNTGICWHGSSNKKDYSVRKDSLENIKKVVNNSYGRTYYLTRDGKAFAKGNNFEGQLGIGSSNFFKKIIFTPHPLPLPTGTVITDLQTGYDNLFMLDQKGTVYVCGSNKYGQLGLGKNKIQVTEPTKINNLPPIRQISVNLVGYNEQLTLLLDENGKVWFSGSLEKNINYQYEFKIMAGLENVAEIFINNNFVKCFLTKSNEVYIYGCEDHPDDLDDYDPKIPFLISEVKNICKIVTQGYSKENSGAYCLDDKGNVYVIGVMKLRNDDNQKAFIRKLPLTDIVQIACDGFSTLYLDKLGTVWLSGSAAAVQNKIYHEDDNEIVECKSVSKIKYISIHNHRAFLVDQAGHLIILEAIAPNNNCEISITKPFNFQIPFLQHNMIKYQLSLDKLLVLAKNKNSDHVFFTTFINLLTTYNHATRFHYLMQLNWEKFDLCLISETFFNNLEKNLKRVTHLDNDKRYKIIQAFIDIYLYLNKEIYNLNTLYNQRRLNDFMSFFDKIKDNSALNSNDKGWVNDKKIFSERITLHNYEISLPSVSTTYCSLKNSFLLLAKQEDFLFLKDLITKFFKLVENLPNPQGLNKELQNLMNDSKELTLAVQVRK